MLSDYKNCRELWKDWLRENRVTPSLLPLISYLCAIVPLVFKLGAWGVFVGLVVFLACLFMPVGKKRILLAVLYVFGLLQCSPLSLYFSRSYRQLLPREECHVEMRLRAVGAMRSKETFREVMRVVEIRDSNGEWRSCDGEVLVRGERGESIELNNGDKIEVEGALLEIGRLQGANDGYVRHLRSLGVGHVLQADLLSACEVKRATGWCAIMQRFYGLREILGVWLTEGMSEECGNLYQAMMLGRRDLFPAGAREHFLRSSSLHVFAISGLHIGIVCAILMKWIFPRLGFGPIGSGIAGLIVSLCYAMMTGTSPSSLRSVLMILLIAVPAALRRGSSLHHALCLAALVELLFNPLLLTHAGFLFSFLVVAVLVSSAPMMTSMRDIVFEKWRWQPFRAKGMWIREKISHTFSLVLAMMLAWLVSTPLMLHLNGLLPFGALVIGLPVQSMAVCLVWGAVIKVFLAACCTWLSCLAGQALDFMMRLMVALAMFGGDESLCYHHRLLTGIEAAVCIVAVMALLWFWHLRFLRIVMMAIIVCWIGAVAMTADDRDAVVIASFGDDGDIPTVCLKDDNGCRVLCCGSMSAAMHFREELNRRGIGRLDHVAVSANGDMPRGASVLCRAFEVRSLTLPTATRSGKVKELREMSSQGTYMAYAEEGRAGGLKARGDSDGAERPFPRGGSSDGVPAVAERLKQGMVGSQFNLDYVCGERRISLRRLPTGQSVLIVRGKGVANCLVRPPSSRGSTVSFRL